MTYDLPQGELTTKQLVLPKHTNSDQDVYAGWLIHEMDVAASTAARKISGGRATTAYVERIEFRSPVNVGDEIACYTDLVDSGRTSMRILVEVYASNPVSGDTRKVTQTEFLLVALDEEGGVRALPALS